MSVKVIAIGDPHIKTDNIKEVDLFIERLIDLITERKPNFVVVLGDILHTHERLHTDALNKAYEMITKLKEICFTVVLVGNHDMVNNSIFLTDDHWMNGMKEWDNVKIVDKPWSYECEGKTFVMAPYVFPGRFEECLNRVEDWKLVDGIFAHQEFKGCKMGAIVSEVGDDWDLDYPFVISGHIHSNQRIQENVYYPGSAMQHAFGESTKNIIPVLEWDDDGIPNLEEVDLKLPRKHIVYVGVEDVDSYKPPENTDDKIRLTVKGNYNSFKTLQKTKKYKELVKKGVKIVFKPQEVKLDKVETEKEDGEEEEKIDFYKMLKTRVDEKNDEHLKKIYNYVISQ